MNKKLLAGWKRRLEMRAEGKKLCAKSDKLNDEYKKLRAELDRLSDEKKKLFAEGTKLYAEGDILWADLILEAHGNIQIEWEWNEEHEDIECHLENGEVYGFEGKAKGC